MAEEPRYALTLIIFYGLPLLLLILALFTLGGSIPLALVAGLLMGIGAIFGGSTDETRRRA